jgi:hypothetical protein
MNFIQLRQILNVSRTLIYQVCVNSFNIIYLIYIHRVFNIIYIRTYIIFKTMLPDVIQRMLQYLYFFNNNNNNNNLSPLYIYKI